MKKILVANRGEIAVRVLKTIKKMGISSVAIYSEVDAGAMHTQVAEEAVYVGESPSSESYLQMDTIIKAAKDLGVDGIHPGYGFLSENAVFANKVAEAGITFIGPSAHSIEIMGSKLAAKEAVKNYDIPMVPGTDTAITDISVAKKFASDIGYPILIKASAGGGGKGMRIVEAEADFEEQMERAVSEAQSAFGDSSVFIEKYITSPRHIEFQILADNHGNVIHLFERECSVQRRHQKVVEEAPSCVLTEDLRSRMGEAAIRVAKSCNYSGAGTVEFLIDGDLNFYFLEMNTRLQVEHPVTEMITGIDLVEQQIRVARDEKLSIAQEDINIDGHALELRVYAEDPKNNFLPDIGTLDFYRLPEGEGVRVDHGFRQGDQIPIYYDPMIAKLVVHNSSRQGAIEKMKAAIKDYVIDGVKTTLEFGAFVCNHEAFVSGDFDTNFVSRHFKSEDLHDEQEIELAAILGLDIYLEEQKKLKAIQHSSKEWTNRK